MQKELDKFEINLEMDHKTQKPFISKKEKILSMLDGTFDITNRLEGTDNYESYTLDLKDVREQHTIIQLHFQDCPGGDLTGADKPKSQLMKHIPQTIS